MVVGSPISITTKDQNQNKPLSNGVYLLSQLDVKSNDEIQLFFIKVPE
jgi:hypothetical protein